MKSFKEYFRSDTSIDRSVMPQIDDIKKYCNKLGLTYKTKMVLPKLIKPTQFNLDNDKVEELMGKVEVETGFITISRDMRIVDGHHRFEAHKRYFSDEEPIVCNIIDAEILDCLDIKV